MTVPERPALAVIPARGGSKRVPRKNIREMAGRPLIAYTIEAALAAASSLGSSSAPTTTRSPESGARAAPRSRSSGPPRSRTTSRPSRPLRRTHSVVSTRTVPSSPTSPSSWPIARSGRRRTFARATRRSWPAVPLPRSPWLATGGRAPGGRWRGTQPAGSSRSSPTVSSSGARIFRSSSARRAQSGGRRRKRSGRAGPTTSRAAPDGNSRGTTRST